MQWHGLTHQPETTHRPFLPIPETRILSPAAVLYGTTIVHCDAL
jgi:hypothetical protein